MVLSPDTSPDFSLFPQISSFLSPLFGSLSLKCSGMKVLMCNFYMYETWETQAKWYKCCYKGNNDKRVLREGTGL